MSTNVLRIDSSARHEGSVSRELISRLLDRIDGDLVVNARDLAHGVPLLSENTLAAMWTPEADRDDVHQSELAAADEYIAELMAADVVVIGLPIYNFGPPAALKAWADLVARAGTTFRYTENGPEGLVENKPVYVVVASGGVPIGSPMDYSSTWLVQFLAFIGLTDVTVVPAGQLNVDPDGAVATARKMVDELDLSALVGAA